MNPKSRRGFSLMELLAAMGLFGLILVILAAAVNQSQRAWRQAYGNPDANTQLRRASFQLRRDLQATAKSVLRTATVPASLPGGGADGDAVWFLSCLNPGTKDEVRQPDGSPAWQRNILYYAVVPSGHTQCGGHASVDNYDDACPHKVLYRKIIDSGTPTTPGDFSSVESVIPNISSQLTRDGSGGGEVVARDLLWFRVRPGNAGVTVEIEAANLSALSRLRSIGSAPLLGEPQTARLSFIVVPEMP